MVLVVLIALIVPIRIGQNYLVLKAYFQDAQDLRPGAAVQLGGVAVGVVTRVRETKLDLYSRGTGPAAAPEIVEPGNTEVTMAIRAVNRAAIPSDAVVSLARSGLVGQSFVQIDVSNTSGTPVRSGAVLRARASQFSPQ